MTKRSSPKLTIETISPYFTQNIQTASKELGICCTLLKKICRKYGITRWPYRKIQSVDRTIQQIKERMSYLETQLPRDSSGSVHLELQKLHREYLELERKRQALLRPDKALINPYNLQPNYRLPFYWGADGVMAQVGQDNMQDTSESRRDEISASWEFPIVDSSPSYSAQTLETSVQTAETESTLRSTAIDTNETVTGAPRQGTFSVERDFGFAESVPLEDSFPITYTDRRRERDFDTLRSAEVFPMRSNDQLSRSSVSQTHGESSFEEPSLHRFLSSPDSQQLDRLLSENTFGDFGWSKRSRHDSLLDCPNALSHDLLRRRSASCIMGEGGRRRGGDELSFEPARRLSISEEMMVGKPSDMEIFSRDQGLPRSHVSETALNWNGTKTENDVQNTLYSLFQRMDQLEQENSRLRNNLSHLVSTIPNPKSIR